MSKKESIKQVYVEMPEAVVADLKVIFGLELD